MSQDSQQLILYVQKVTGIVLWSKKLKSAYFINNTNNYKCRPLIVISNPLFIMHSNIKIVTYENITMGTDEFVSKTATKPK